MLFLLMPTIYIMVSTQTRSSAEQGYRIRKKTLGQLVQNLSLRLKNVLRLFVMT